MSVRVESVGSVATLRMDWPDKRNSIGPIEADELYVAFESARQSMASVVVLCASPPAFCAGGDLAAIAELARDGGEAVRQTIYGRFQRLIRAIVEFPGVTIAAVDGAAVGLGVDLCLACDHRYIGPAGWLSQGWAGIKAIPGTGGAWLATRIAGPRAAWEMLLSQRRVDAALAERLGLAIAVEEAAEATAMERAQWMAAQPLSVVKAYKALINTAQNETFDAHLARCLEYQVEFLTSSEFFAAADSILAKRSASK